jgi:thiol-disulfide isomerase/thioredoxin
MSRSRRSLSVVAFPVVLLAACGNDETASSSTPVRAEATTTVSIPDESIADESTTDVTPDDAVPVTTDAISDAAVPATTEVIADLPAYQALTIADVDGVTFTLHDLAGRPVIVEAFATWCSKCRAQLERTNAAAAELGDGAVVLALSVETDLSAADVASYAADNGFTNIRFAVMTPELLAAFVDAFGNSIANPPSTPIVVLDPMGHAGELSTGGQDVAELVDTVRAVAG